MITLIKQIRSMDKSSKRRSALYLIIGIIMLAFLLMNDYANNSFSFELGEARQEDGGYIYSQAFSLPSGEYRLNFSYSGTRNGGEISIEDRAGEVYYVGSMSDSSGEMTLDKTVTELVVKTASSDSSAAVKELRVEADGAIYADKFFLAFLLFLGILYLLYVKFVKKSDEESQIHLFLIAIGLFVSYPLFTFYLQEGDDLAFHLCRIDGIVSGLQSGQFPVRLYPDMLNGHGYGVSLFYPELFLYFPAVLRFIGISQITAYKTLLIAANIATAFIAYYSVKEISRSKFTGLIGAVIYTTSTWRLINFYDRAALGEALSMVFFPLIILGVYNILFGDKNKWYVFALAYTFMFQSHIIGTFISALFILIMLLVNVKKLFSDRRIFGLIKAGALIVLLNLWYLIPFVSGYFSMDLAINATNSASNFQNGAIIPAQLFNIFNDWSGISQVLSFGINPDMPLSLGVGVSIALVLCMVYFIRNKKEEDRISDHRFNLQMFIFTLVCIFMTTSLFPWDYLRDSSRILYFFENTLQFPWRLLSIITAIISLTGAMLIAKYCYKHKKLTIAALCITLGLSFVLYATEYTRTASIYAQKGVVATSADDAMERFAWQYLTDDADPDALKAGEYKTSDGSIDVEELSKDGSRIEFSVSGQKDGGYVEVPLYYYPGYTARDDNGNKLDVSAGDNNVVRIGIDGDTGDNITVKFGCAAYTFGDIVSLLTILISIAYAVLKKRFNTDPLEYLRRKFVKNISESN